MSTTAVTTKWAVAVVGVPELRGSPRSRGTGHWICGSWNEVERPAPSRSTVDRVVERVQRLVAARRPRGEPKRFRWDRRVHGEPGGRYHTSDAHRDRRAATWSSGTSVGRRRALGARSHGCDGRLVASGRSGRRLQRLGRHGLGAPSVVALRQVDGRDQACKAGPVRTITGHAGEQALAALRPFGVDMMFTLNGGHVWPLLRGGPQPGRPRRRHPPRADGHLRRRGLRQADPHARPGRADRRSRRHQRRLGHHDARGSTARRSSCSADGRRSGAGARARCRSSTTCRSWPRSRRRPATVHRRRAGRPSRSTTRPPRP